MPGGGGGGGAGGGRAGPAGGGGGWAEKTNPGGAGGRLGPAGLGAGLSGRKNQRAGTRVERAFRPAVTAWNHAARPRKSVMKQRSLTAPNRRIEHRPLLQNINFPASAR